MRLPLALLACLASAATTVHAANFTVTPVRVEISPKQRSAALTVHNESEEQPVTIQLQLLSWSQDDGQDRYLPTTDLLATPPIFTVPPGKSQTVRVAFRKAPEGAQEIAYRLLLREVPVQRKSDFTGIQIALEMNLPVFLSPERPVAPKLVWRADRPSGDWFDIRLRNEGSAHVQLANLRLSTSGSDAPIAADPGFVYLLPGQSHGWRLKRTGGAANLTEKAIHLKAYSDAGNVDVDLPFENP